MSDDDENDADKALWEAAMRDVKRLSGKRTPSKKINKNAKKQSVRAAGPIIRETVILPPKQARTVDTEGKGLDKRTDQRLKRGKMEIEGTIDLHGFRQKEARAELERQLTRFHKQGKRCILVITGQGRDKASKNDADWWETKPGILRKMVPDWLGQKPLSDLVLQFHVAKQQDGGLGALYVLLRRTRSA